MVHDLLGTDEVRDVLVAELGDEVAPDGVIDRRAVAERVFGDDERRKWLESVLWPRVGQAIADWREGQVARDTPPRAAIVETPLLFEAGMDKAYEFTIAVIADEEIRRERAEARGHAGARRAHRAPAHAGGKGSKSGLRGPQRWLRRRVGEEAVGST